uniref:PPIase cyclophilin-type domain-containing protein n=1 Tax=Noctiluca scintillans TaxID=2966 RepID=A0A7S1FCA2_NOCSC|mmetsp:Transcript_49260/g.130479  ORF Transcript_49260/g.130479 Transcript_49260/m.130479 type:complete len:280 (+) Transcript_49260:49-888(+)
MGDDEFQFVIPDCEPGTVLKVPAPDGMSLTIPLPASLQPGDRLVMKRGGDGEWSVSRAMRGSPAESPQVATPPASGGAPLGWKSSAEIAAELTGPGVITAKLDTTKGIIEMRIVPRWSPVAVRRFLQLIDDGFFREIAIYRAINRGLLQFGVIQEHDPRASQYQVISDDPLMGVPYEEGSVSFAASGPGTRKHTLCLFLGDFRDQLGTKQPETVIGKVSPAFFDTMHSLFTGYGDIPQCGGSGPDPSRLSAEGNDYIFQEFPNCDFIMGADWWYDPRWT